MSVKWTMRESQGGFVISDGRCSFRVGPAYDGSGRKEQYPDGVIVSPELARRYADAIFDALNRCEAQP